MKRSSVVRESEFESEDPGFDSLARQGVKRSSVVRESEFESEDPGFDPLAGQGEKRLLCG